MRECGEYEITVSKLLNIVHWSTERIKIHVVSDAAMIADKQRDFYITENLSGSREERDRVLKYYGDTPVWNIHIEFDNVLDYPGRGVIAAIVANCHYSDIREGFEREKADKKKAKRREYYRRRKEEDSNA